MGRVMFGIGPQKESSGLRRTELYEMAGFTSQLWINVHTTRTCYCVSSDGDSAQMKAKPVLFRFMFARSTPDLE